MSSQVRQAGFTAQLIHLDGHAEVALVGELDIVSVDILQPVLDGLIEQGHADLRLNAAALTFLDAAGVECLVRARQQAVAVGGSLRIEALHHRPRRVLEICDVLSILTIEADPTRPDVPVRA